jgi:hypothetical protein
MTMIHYQPALIVVIHSFENHLKININRERNIMKIPEIKYGKTKDQIVKEFLKTDEKIRKENIKDTNKIIKLHLPDC